MLIAGLIRSKRCCASSSCFAFRALWNSGKVIANTSRTPAMPSTRRRFAPGAAVTIPRRRMMSSATASPIGKPIHDERLSVSATTMAPSAKSSPASVEALSRSHTR